MPATIRSHLVQEDDGAWHAAWSPFILKSAFQPIYAFQGGKLAVVAFEALLRPTRDGQPVPPLTFFAELPAAERVFIENLSHSLHLLNAAHLPPEAEIFINFDPSVFVDKGVAETVIRRMRVILGETGIDPRRIVCEITEKRALSQDVLFSLVSQLRASGLRIAVDDYGVDDSDIGRIRDLHPDIVKFDAEWINRLMRTDPGVALLGTMVSTFVGQGIRTVFEGIENGWQIELAEKSEVSMLQGFALAKPELAPINFVVPDMPDQPDPGATPTRPAGRSAHRAQKTFGRRTSSR